jgi:hypothetical protein
MTNEPKEVLVKPSGRLSNYRLIVRMHYPNFCRCRKFFDFLDMVDIFNTSMATLMDKLGIWSDRSCGRVLLQDLFCRRIPIPTGTNKELNRFGYAQDVVKAHVQFADDVWEQCDAPVGLLIGATVVEQYMRSGSRTDTVHVALEPRRMAFRSVGKFQLEFGVFVEYRSGEHGREMHRLVFYTLHPERFARTRMNQAPGFQPSTNADTLHSLAMDRMVDVCAALALGRVPSQSMAVNYEQVARPVYATPRKYSDGANAEEGDSSDDE